MGTLGNALACLAAGTAALAPIDQAAACTPVSVVTVDSTMLVDAKPRTKAEWAHMREMRRACARIHPTDDRLLHDVRQGRYGYDYVLDLVSALETGNYGCEKERGFAFQLLDALLPEPIPFDSAPYTLQLAAERAPRNKPLISDERYRQIMGARWLLATNDYSLSEQGWSQREVERFLLRPGNWEYAVAHFGPGAQALVRIGDIARTNYGSNGDRDRTVFRLLADPSSARYDPALAVQLARSGGQSPFLLAAVDLLLDPASGLQDAAQAVELANGTADVAIKRYVISRLLDPQTGTPDIAGASEVAARGHDRQIKLDTARLLLDPALGEPGLEAARSLLGWYSPYVHLETAEDGPAAAMWQEIAQRMAASDDPLTRSRGEGILRTGDPQFGAKALPEVAGDLLELERWPESLPAIDYRRAEFWSEMYPARAIRDELAGLTGLGVLFGPDGAFQQVWVIRPSGVDSLDKAAMLGAERYFRPRLKDLHLSGHPGRHVLVPLVEFAWHLGGTPERAAGARVADGRIEIVAEPVKWQSAC